MNFNSVTAFFSHYAQLQYINTPSRYTPNNAVYKEVPAKIITFCKRQGRNNVVVKRGGLDVHGVCYLKRYHEKTYKIRPKGQPWFPGLVG
jgi:hypothetical protein